MESDSAANVSAMLALLFSLRAKEFPRGRAGVTRALLAAVPGPRNLPGRTNAPLSR